MPHVDSQYLLYLFVSPITVVAIGLVLKLVFQQKIHPSLVAAVIVFVLELLVRKLVVSEHILIALLILGGGLLSSAPSSTKIESL